MNDFSFEDYGMEGEGIVQVFSCQNCGADVECYVPLDGGDDGDDVQGLPDKASEG